MWPSCPQPPAPLQEGPQRGVCVRRDAALVLLGPHFQAGQRHLNVQSPENLWAGRGGTEVGDRATVPVLLLGDPSPFPLLIPKPTTSPGTCTPLSPSSPEGLCSHHPQPGPHSWRPPGDAVWCGLNSGAGSRTGKAAIKRCESSVSSTPAPAPLGFLSPGCGQPRCTAPGILGFCGPPASPGRGNGDPEGQA